METHVIWMKSFEFNLVGHGNKCLVVKEVSRSFVFIRIKILLQKKMAPDKSSNISLLN